MAGIYLDSVCFRLGGIMKKILFGFLMAILLFTVGATSTQDIQVELDGATMEFDVQPIIINGRVLVPFRKIFEELDLRVDWNNELKIATAYTEQDTLAIKVDSGFASINGEMFDLDVPASIRDGRMLVPLRFISESFQNQVDWDEASATVRIKSGVGPAKMLEDLPVVGSQDRLISILEYANKNLPYETYRADLLLEEAVMSDDMVVNAPEASSSDSTLGASDFSDTNVQVAGVDEADIVKTDGDYIYYIRSSSNQIGISKVDGERIIQTSKLDLTEGFAAKEMYYNKDRLIVIGSTDRPYYLAEPMLSRSKQTSYRSGSSLKVLIYDVSNRMKPIEERTIELEGYYITSRLIEDNFYLVAKQDFYMDYLENPTDFLPTLFDSSMGGERLIGYDEIRYFPGSVESNLLIMLGLDISEKDKETDIDVYLGSGQSVYVSHQNMYVAYTSYDYYYDSENSGSDEFYYPVYESNTEVFKFEIDNGKSVYKGKGKVPGIILNQFSMDEDQGYFRIATTTGDSWRTDEKTSKNNVYVLDENLGIVGKLEGLAPTEKIYSVRFMGDRAYMVTFRQVDPFYVIDMTDPMMPQVLGYLKIPGFSDYLHPYDENHIIGFGKDTAESKWGTSIEGMKIGLFDVTDVENPIEEDTITIGVRGSFSELLDNHKALLFSKEKSLMAFPITVMQENADNWSSFEFQGAYFYQIDPDKGFELKGKVTHLSSLDYISSGDYWYDSEKNIRRIIYIGDYLYTLSDYQIQAHDIDNLSTQGTMRYEQ